MYYGLYLIGMACFLYLGEVFSDGVLHIANIYRFVDMATLAVIVVPCALLLLCTQSFGAFRDALLFMVGKKEASAAQCRKSLDCLKGVVCMACLSGGVWAVISTIKFLFELTGPEALGPFVVLVCLALLYPLFIALILLPVMLFLKNRLLTFQEPEVRK